MHFQASPSAQAPLLTPVTPEGLCSEVQPLTHPGAKRALQPWILEPAGGTRLLGYAPAT